MEPKRRSSSSKSRHSSDTEGSRRTSSETGVATCPNFNLQIYDTLEKLFAFLSNGFFPSISNILSASRAGMISSRPLFLTFLGNESLVLKSHLSEMRRVIELTHPNTLDQKETKQPIIPSIKLIKRLSINYEKDTLYHKRLQTIIELLQDIIKWYTVSWTERRVLQSQINNFYLMNMKRVSNTIQISIIKHLCPELLAYVSHRKHEESSIHKEHELESAAIMAERSAFYTNVFEWASQSTDACMKMLDAFSETIKGVENGIVSPTTRLARTKQSTVSVSEGFTQDTYSVSTNRDRTDWAQQHAYLKDSFLIWLQTLDDYRSVSLFHKILPEMFSKFMHLVRMFHTLFIDVLSSSEGDTISSSADDDFTNRNNGDNENEPSSPSSQPTITNRIVRYLVHRKEEIHAELEGAHSEIQNLQTKYSDVQVNLQHQLNRRERLFDQVLVLDTPSTEESSNTASESVAKHSKGVGKRGGLNENAQRVSDTYNLERSIDKLQAEVDVIQKRMKTIEPHIYVKHNQLVTVQKIMIFFADLYSVIIPQWKTLIVQESSLAISWSEKETKYQERYLFFRQMTLQLLDLKTRTITSSTISIVSKMFHDMQSKHISWLKSLHKTFSEHGSLIKQALDVIEKHHTDITLSAQDVSMEIRSFLIKLDNTVVEMDKCDTFSYEKLMRQTIRDFIAEIDNMTNNILADRILTKYLRKMDEVCEQDEISALPIVSNLSKSAAVWIEGGDVEKTIYEQFHKHDYGQEEEIINRLRSLDQTMTRTVKAFPPVV